MKTLTQHIKESLRIGICDEVKVSVCESLRIGINDKPELNSEFYDKFGENFNIDNDANIEWYEVSKIQNIIPTYMPSEWANHVKNFFGDDKSYIRYADNSRYNKSMTFLYYDIRDYIKDPANDIELIYKNMNTYNKNSDYFIYLLVTNNLKLAIWGYTYIDNAHKGSIMWQRFDLSNPHGYSFSTEDDW